MQLLIGHGQVPTIMPEASKSIIETTLFFLITDNYYVCTKEILRNCRKIIA